VYYGAVQPTNPCAAFEAEINASADERFDECFNFATY